MVARALRIRAGPMDLSPRELQITVLVSLGYQNREIANTLRVSVETSSSHLARVYKKTGAASRLDLALLALGHGLVDLELCTKVAQTRAAVNKHVGAYEW